MKLVEVVIPLYKTDLSSLEKKVLRNNLRILENYPVVIISPESLDVNEIDIFKSYDNIRIERFEDQYFSGIAGYNLLVLSPDFYKRFLGSEYILICQTDAFVFRDELKYWCEKRYDYIGAPWIASPRNLINKIFASINSFIRILKGKKIKNTEHFFKVGNGGFSLRKVESFYRISDKYRDMIADYNKDKEGSIYYVEDVFWSLKVPTLEPDFSIPDYTEALAFAIDRKPDIALKLNKYRIPFGCHGFDKPKVSKFWNPILQEYLDKNNI